MGENSFDDLFGEVDLLRDSLQGPLTRDAANMTSVQSESTLSAVRDIHESHAFSAGDGPEDGHGTSPLHSSSRERDGVGPSPSPMASVPGKSKLYPNAVVIDKIEACFEDITDALLNEKDHISIALKTRRSHLKSEVERDNPGRRISYPGRTADEAWRFAVVLRIMELMHEALRNDMVISKRDIYYRDPALFGAQTRVDRYIDDIAFTFGVTRTALNVTAVAKGLVAGAASFLRKGGSVVDLATDREGILVPSLKDVLSVKMDAVKWILVVEKEATFRSIASSPFWNVLSSEGVMITGKGYPDLSTRALLHYLSTASAQNGFAASPVFGLADFDPDGVAILSTYKHGSKALAHESQSSCVPQLQWLGLRSQHLGIAADDTVAAQGSLALTARDRKKANKMLEQNMSLGTGDALLWRTELQTMLMLNVKAELQLLDALPNGMTALLSSELSKV